MHDLKYFTWVEQLDKDVRDVDAQWYDDYWTRHFHFYERWDRRITELNKRMGLPERHQ